MGLYPGGPKTGGGLKVGFYDILKIRGKQIIFVALSGVLWKSLTTFILVKVTQ